MLHQFKIKLEHDLKKSKREPKQDLKPVQTDGMFNQRKVDKINAFKKEALEAGIIKMGKPRVPGSHGY